MKEFVVYTALRLVLFAATLGVVLGVWSAVAGDVNVLVAVVAAFVVSGLGSWYLLQRPRDAFARKVEARAERATAAFDALRAREDAEAQAAQAAQAAGTAAAGTAEVPDPGAGSTAEGTGVAPEGAPRSGGATPGVTAAD